MMAPETISALTSGFALGLACVVHLLLRSHSLRVDVGLLAAEHNSQWVVSRISGVLLIAIAASQAYAGA
jgi:hypothetical protein